jgi:hypothetical protein
MVHLFHPDRVPLLDKALSLLDSVAQLVLLSLELFLLLVSRQKPCLQLSELRLLLLALLLHLEGGPDEVIECAFMLKETVLTMYYFHTFNSSSLACPCFLRLVSSD